MRVSTRSGFSFSDGENSESRIAEALVLFGHFADDAESAVYNVGGQSLGEAIVFAFFHYGHNQFIFGHAQDPFTEFQQIIIFA